MHMKWRKICFYMIYWVPCIVFTTVLWYFTVYHSRNKRHKNLNIIKVYMMHIVHLSKNMLCWNMGAGIKNSLTLQFQYGSWTICWLFLPVRLMSGFRCGQNLVYSKSLNSCLSHCCRSPGIIVFLFRLSLLLQKRIWPLCGLVLEAYCIKFKLSGMISYFDNLWMKMKGKKFTLVSIHNGECVKWDSCWKWFAGCGVFCCHSSV
jgi:hypothetical protein